MVDQARLAAGETVLVHAAGSGVGTAAIQIATAMARAPIGTARTADKLERPGRSGWARASWSRGESSPRRSASEPGGRGVDVVVELVGGATWRRTSACVAPRGGIVVMGLWPARGWTWTSRS